MSDEIGRPTVMLGQDGTVEVRAGDRWFRLARVGETAAATASRAGS
jgi:hypothetical protein